MIKQVIMFLVAATSIITMRITEPEIISSLEKYSGSSFLLQASWDKFALVLMSAFRNVFLFSCCVKKFRRDFQLICLKKSNLIFIRLSLKLEACVDVVLKL